jgi:predicted nucleic acid-binding protein
MIYFDSNYVAKCYLNELGSPPVRRLAQSQNSLCCSEFGRIEVVSTFHRNWRERLLTKAQLEIVVAQFEADDASGVWTWLPFTPDLCRETSTRIKSLPASTFIRAGDALHLCSAAENGFSEIYSNDRHLLAAASFFGLRPMNVIP